MSRLLFDGWWSKIRSRICRKQSSFQATTSLSSCHLLAVRLVLVTLVVRVVQVVQVVLVARVVLVVNRVFIGCASSQTGHAGLAG